MLLHSLQMSNFKRFREETIQFQDGITGIIGNNGSGKSTIVEAILFALYGVQGTGIDPDHIVSSFAGERERAAVRLDFSASGNDYSVVRYFRRTASSTQHEAHLFLGEREIAKGVTEVLQKTESIIGMGPADLRNTIYTAQKDLLSLIESQPGERRRWFMKVLGIDALRDGTDEEIKGLIDDRKQQFLDLSGRLKEIDAENLQQRIAADREREKDLKKEQKTLLGEKAAVSGDAERLRSSLEALRKREREHIRLKENLIARRTEKKSVEVECNRIAGEIAARQMLRDELRSLEDQERRLTDVEKELEVQEGRRLRYEELIADLKQQRYEREVHLHRTKALEEEEERLEMDASRLENLMAPVSRLEECRRLLEGLKEREQDYTRLRDDAAKVRAGFSGVEEQIQRLSGELERLREREQELFLLDHQVIRLDDLIQDEERLSRAEPQAEQRKFWERRRREIESELVVVDEDLRKISREIEEIGDIEARIHEEESRRDAAAEQKSGCRTRYIALVDALEDLERRNREIEGAGPEGLCPMCHQPLRDHFDSLLTDLQAEEQGIQDQIASMESGYKEASAALEEVQENLGHLNGRRLQVQGLRESLAARQSDRRAFLEQREKAEREVERSGAALQDLGVSEFDPDLHRALKREIKELAEKKTRADALRGECIRMHDLTRELERLGLEGERCIAEEELILTEIERLGYQPKLKREIEQEVASLMKPWEEFLQIQERLRAADAVKGEASRIRETLESLQARIQGTEGAISTLGFDPDAYACLLSSCRQAAECRRRHAEVAVRVGEIPSLEDRLREKRETERQVERVLAQIEASLVSLDFKESDLAETDTALQEKIESAHRLEGVLSRLERDISHLREGIDAASSDLKRSLQYQDECNRIQEETELLKLTRKLISVFITHLLSVVRERIEGEAGRILSEITDGRYDSVLIDEKFDMLIHDMGNDYPCSRFSGGEQDDIAIALRIALSRYLAEMHQIHDSTFLIFDEIFGSQDEERRNNLIQALRSQESNFPQILLISHISDVQGEFASTLLVELMQHAESRVREVTS